MNIHDGWQFYRADFSDRATHQEPVNGFVVLIRTKQKRKLWHELHKDSMDSHSLEWAFVEGKGETFYGALADANAKARAAGPVE